MSARPRNEVDTLGGYLVIRAGHVPVRGELVPGPNPFEAEVLDADPRRVKRVKIYRRKDRRPAHRRANCPRWSKRRRPRPAPTPPRDESNRPSPNTRVRREAEAADPCDRAGLGLAAVADRVRRRRVVGAGDGAVQCLADPVSDVSDAGLADRRRRRRPLGRRHWRPPSTGWWFGFGYFVAGLYWIGYAFLVDAPTFGWLLPFAVIGLPAVLAIYTAFGVALARMLWTRGAMRILALGVALTATEWLRGHLFTGFPWNAFGYALDRATCRWRRALLCVGIWGLTFIAIVRVRKPRHAHRRPQPKPAGRGCRWRSASSVLAGLGGWGALRLQRTPTRLRRQSASAHHAAQPAAGRALQLCGQAAGDGPLYRAFGSRHRPAIARRARRDASDLAGIAFSVLSDARTRRAGADRQAVAARHRADHRRDAASPKPDNPGDPRAYNSIYVIDHDGSILAVYDKVHLVPFGEYLPFEHLLERLGLQELTKQRGGFLAGDAADCFAFRALHSRFRSFVTRSFFPDE